MGVVSPSKTWMGTNVVVVITQNPPTGLQQAVFNEKERTKKSSETQLAQFHTAELAPIF